MLKRFIRFAIIGGLGTIINIVIFTSLNLMGLNYITSAIISFIISATFNYILNYLYVFNDRNTTHSKRLWLKFMSIATLSLGINLIILYTMANFVMPHILKIDIIQQITNFLATMLHTKDLSKITDIYAQCTSIGLTMIFNFIGNNYITFKKHD